MESEFEIPGHGLDYCIILVSKPRLLALLFSPVICVFKKIDASHAIIIVAFLFSCFQYSSQYSQYSSKFQFFSKKISGRIFQTVLCYLQFLSAVVTQGPKQPYNYSGSFLKWITMQKIILVHPKPILLKPERHCTTDEHVVKRS